MLEGQRLLFSPKTHIGQWYLVQSSSIVCDCRTGSIQETPEEMIAFVRFRYDHRPGFIDHIYIGIEIIVMSLHSFRTQKRRIDLSTILPIIRENQFYLRNTVKVHPKPND